MGHTTQRQFGRHWVAAAALAGLALAAGCDSTDGQRTKIVVPSAATSAPEYEGDGEIPEQRYVIRMSDGERDWEVEFPSVATGYEMHIPLEKRGRGGPGDINWQGENLTRADKELLRQLRRKNPQMEREGVYRGGENVLDNRGEGRRPARRRGESRKKGRPQNGQPKKGKKRKKGKRNKGQPRPGLSKKKKQPQQGKTRRQPRRRSEAEPAPSRPSYLLGLQQVRKLYRNGNYEVALVRLVKLEEAYPGDEQILSMKGSLWLKLDRPKLARKAWERVLQINPDNRKVRKALQRLNKQNSSE